MPISTPAADSPDLMTGVRQRKRSWTTAITALALLGVACGGGESGEPEARDAGATSPTEAEHGPSDGSDDVSDEVSSEIPDACILLDVDEISAVIGREVAPGQPETTPEDASSCRFETLTGTATSVTYEDPAILETALGSVTISTAPSGVEEFDELEALVGEEAEVVSGVGDDAYFWGENIIYVRVADWGLTVRIEADEADTTAVRGAVLRLAELGASKLA